MSNERSGELASIFYGTITAVGVGAFLLQALGTLVLGIIGALGGYLFHKLLKPKIDKLLKKKS